MRILRFWPSALTRTALPPSTAKGPMSWPRALMVPVFVTLVALFAACGIAAEFHAARLDLLAATGQPQGIFHRALVTARGTGLLELWSSVAIFLLGVTMGYALTSSSFAGNTAGDDRLTRLYGTLIDEAARRRLPENVAQWLEHVNRQVTQLDASRSALAGALRAAWHAARTLESAAIGPDAERRAALIDAAFGFRRLSAVLETREQHDPLDSPGHAVRLAFVAARGSEPKQDRDTRSLELQFLLFGEGLDVDVSALDFVLPSRGDSVPVRVPVRFTAPNGRLRVFVTQRGQADVLQEFDISVVAPA